MSTQLQVEISERVSDAVDAGRKGPAIPAEGRRGRPRKRRVMMTAGILLGLAAVAYGARAYAWSLHHVSTDDAFIDGHIIQVSPQVLGHVVEVLVNDNQMVKRGDVLLRIDPRDYQARLDSANAALQLARAKEAAAKTQIELATRTATGMRERAAATVTVAQTAIEQAQAQVASALRLQEQDEADVAADRATLDRDQGDLARAREMAGKGIASNQELDHAASAVKVSQAQLDAAIKKVASAEAVAAQAKAGLAQARAQLVQAQAALQEADVVRQKIDVAEAQLAQAAAEVKEAQATVRTAELNLSYTTITATEDGRVTRKSVEAGNFIITGQPVMAIVPAEVWVTANFKETQLTHMKASDPVEVTIDAYPGVTLKGHVDSIQAGTGARFSLLPPENATGNYIKVVQRVPVKIVIENAEGRMLSPGMSVVPEVKVE